MGSPNK
jgi:hypothetical protein